PPRSTLFPYTTLFRSLRTIGEGVRDILPAFWLRALAKECVGMHSVIVPDIRHPEDADACAVLLNVTRPGVNSDGHSTERDMSPRSEEHTSELQSRENL